MSKSKITGRIDAISDYSDKDYFNVALDDANQDENWFIGDGSLRDHGDFEVGDNVRVTVDGNKGGVTDVEKMNVSGGGSEGGQSSAAQGSGAGDSGDGEFSDAGESSTDTFLPKSKRIMLQVAFKKAVDESSADAVEEQGEHLEQVSELTNGYYNLLSAQVKDKSGGEQ